MPRTLLATIVALAVAAGCRGSGAESAPDRADVAGELTRQERIWTEAIKNRDRQVLDRLLADDFIFTDDEGNVYDKEQYISTIVDLIRVASYTVDQTAIHVHGDTAIVVGRWTGTQTIDGQDASGAFRFTDTFVRRPDGWQGVASHDTRIPSSTAQPQ
jgi:ketosteroid isomerase-like protein